MMLSLYCSLQYVEKHRVVGSLRHKNLKNGGIQYRFLFGEYLKAILYLVESDSFDELPENVSMVTETSLKCRLKSLKLTPPSKAPKHSRLQKDCSVTFHKNTTKKISTNLIMRLSYPKTN